MKRIVDILDLDMSAYDRIVEPFCGGSAFTLGTIGDQCGWLNDMDHDLYCLWRSVIRFPDDLCEAVQEVEIEPDDFYRLQSKLLRDRPKVTRRDAVVRRALDKLVVHKISFSNMGEMSGSPVGGKDQTGKWKFDCRWKPDLICARIQKASKLLDRTSATDWSFEKVMRHASPRDFFFIDPPYVDAGAKCYKHSFTLTDHNRLAAYVKALPCDWAVTYDYHPHILKLYDWANIYDLEFNYFMSSAYRAGEEMKVGKELLMTRPE